MAQSQTNFSEVILKDDAYPLVPATILNQLGIERNSATIPFSKLVQLNVALDALQPTPPNANTVWFDNTILLDNLSGTTNTMNNTSITIDDTVNSGPKNTLTTGDITINDFGSSAVAQMSSDYLQLTTSASQVKVDTFENHIKFTNNNNNAQLTVGNDLTGLSNPNMNIINTNDSDLFINSQTNQFFKFNTAGYSYKPLLVAQDAIIERYMNYVVFDNGITNVNINTVNSLLDSDTTLLDAYRVGWSCKFANLNGFNVTISNIDGLQYFSH